MQTLRELGTQKFLLGLVFFSCFLEHDKHVLMSVILKKREKKKKEEEETPKTCQTCTYRRYGTNPLPLLTKVNETEVFRAGE